MATRKEFCDEMITVYENHGMYVGTGNGELTLNVAGKFFEMEKSYGRRDDNGNPLWYTDTARDYEYLGKCYRNKWDMTKSRAGDCSGQIVGAMRRLGIISKSADYSAKMFQTECTDVALKDLKYSDLVFDKKKDSKGKGTASHVGVFDGEMVVESKGRDAGVVRRPVSEGSWVVGGRLPDDWFDPEYPPLTRNLYYIKGDRMTGDDVLRCKEQLCRKGYLKSKYVDDIFGKHTDEATRKFQEENGLTVDGIIGQKTYKKLME